MKHLRLGIIARNNGQVAFRVIHQEKRGDSFCGSNGEFRYGPVILSSYNYPEIDGEFVFLRGDEREKDNTILIVSDARFSAIRRAVAAYNQKMAEKEKPVEPKLPRDIIEVVE